MSVEFPSRQGVVLVGVLPHCILPLGSFTFSLLLLLLCLGQSFLPLQVVHCHLPLLHRIKIGKRIAGKNPQQSSFFLVECHLKVTEESDTFFAILLHPDGTGWLWEGVFVRRFRFGCVFNIPATCPNGLFAIF